MAELNFKVSPKKTIPFKLIGDLTTIGRDPNNSIVIDHPSVSPFHAEILFVHSEEQYEVFDLGSPNGTQVNEERIIRKPLFNGDQIQFGKLKAEILCEASNVSSQGSDLVENKKDTAKNAAPVARAPKKPAPQKLVKARPPEARKKVQKAEKLAVSPPQQRVQKAGKPQRAVTTNRAETKITELEKDIVAYQNTIRNLRNTNSKLQLKVNAAENPQKIEDSLKKYKKKNKNLDQKADALKGKIKKRKAKILDLKKRETEFQSLIQSIESLEKESARLLKENSSIKEKTSAARKNQKVVEAEITKSIKSAESAAANKIALANKEAKTALDELEADVQQIKDAREAAKVLLVEKKKAIKKFKII